MGFLRRELPRPDRDQVDMCPCIAPARRQMSRSIAVIAGAARPCCSWASVPVEACKPDATGRRKCCSLFDQCLERPVSLSGLAGIIRFDGAPIDPVALRRMTADLSHRARGGVRHVHGEGVALVLCRPYAMILPHDEQGHASSTDGAVTLVMDGRLDNRDALSALLLQHRTAFRSREDAALVLAAYETFGEGFLRHVDGDFAIVIWDGRKRSVLLARDRFGVRPLFYHLDGHVLSFASEVRPVLDLPWVPKSFNHCAALRMMSRRRRSVSGDVVVRHRAGAGWPLDHGLVRRETGRALLGTGDSWRRPAVFRGPLHRRLPCAPG